MWGGQLSEKCHGLQVQHAASAAQKHSIGHLNGGVRSGPDAVLRPTGCTRRISGRRRALQKPFSAAGATAATASTAASAGRVPRRHQQGRSTCRRRQGHPAIRVLGETAHRLALCLVCRQKQVHNHPQQSANARFAGLKRVLCVLMWRMLRHSSAEVKWEINSLS